MANKKTAVALDDIIDDLIEDKLYNLHTAIPAKVESFNGNDKTIEATPVIKKTFEDGDEVTLPTIKDIPILYPQAANFSITFPLEKGDTVLLVMSERSIEKWKNNGDVVNPQDVRRHDYSDAVAIPALYKIGGGESAETSKIKIKFYDAIIEMTDQSEIEVKNNNGSIKLEQNGDVDIDTGANGAARKTDEIKSLAADDATFWSFITTLFATFNAHVHATAAPGPPSPPATPLTSFPTSLTGQITGGSTKVKIG